ncbi:hypothetical protein KAFR_0G03190 [Kazachstania africana CBS 2517]|uniref:CRAL-TRIO domain-containing protein n=1 Tax=Kazachstania africana (strain ATCC 22294 / BCRC 22015 / CBS 2517 / CECT 1963 / NBRC 1671 / NRRL Y-8276) TaxID=1071382 RepID=H2AYA1_KAZAF|nr:hypothetical protein KAFR_0G03190 [Kazachstania africana CBS 2517]CCF59351.1 hypothetical protein KAFR_0G03190 [Kazachstania africana CBS 2517]
MTQDAYATRLQNISKDQEQILKQIWTYLFHFWEYEVDGTNAFKPTDEQLDAMIQEQEKKLKKKSFFSRSSSSRTENLDKQIQYQKNVIHDSLKDMNPDDTRDAFWDMIRADFPDNLLLRFIRARDWDVDKAMKMIAFTMDWRVNESKADEIIYGGERAAWTANEPGFIKNLELKKAVICGVDKEGRPIVYVRPKLHHSDDQTLEEMKKYSLLIIEQARLFLREPVETATVIFDLSGFGVSNMDYTPVQFIITCFEAHYPECLGKLFIHNAPWIFPPMWNIIKKWLDPVVASKISFTKTVDDLLEHVDLENIPQSLGGQSKISLDGIFEKPDESYDEKMQDHETLDILLVKRKELIENFLEITRKWIESDGDDESAQLLKERIEAGRKLTRNYIDLDPYIRSRSLYDIQEILKF